MKKKWWIVIIVIVAGLGIGGYILTQRTGAQNAAMASANGEENLAVAERGTLRITVDGSGSLEPQSEVAISFESGGEVVEVMVEVGDEIKAGDVIARLEDTDARRSLADAELQVRQNEASLASSQLKLDALVEWEADEDAVRLAQANLDAAKADYKRIVASNARVADQLTSVEVKLNQALRNLDDVQEDYDSAFDPGREWELGDRFRSTKLENEREAAENALLRTQEDVSIAQANYNLQVVGISDSDVKNAWSKVVNAEVSLEREQTAPDDDDIESARLQVQQSEISLAQARLKLESVQQALDDTALIAPVDGTITQLNLTVGQMASAGQSTVILADLATLIVDIGLDEGDIAQVSMEQAAVVTLDAFDDVELRGTITAIAPAADVQAGVVLYPVTIALDPTNLPVRAGMTADVEIVTSSAEETLLIPLKAVRSVGGGTFVLRKLAEGETLRQPAVDQGQMTETMQQMIAQGFAPVSVELGLVTETHAEVLFGLEAGDVVSIASAASSNNDATDGMPRPGMMMGGGPRP